MHKYLSTETFSRSILASSSRIAYTDVDDKRPSVPTQGLRPGFHAHGPPVHARRECQRSRTRARQHVPGRVALAAPAHGAHCTSD